MAETGVHRHAGARASNQRRHATQIQLGRYARMFKAGDDALGTRFFDLAAPR